MKVKIPEELKADVPQTLWGKMLSATPVIMTVVATLLAGLASSEMTRAQYDRAYGAQLQSKAGDQWNYFQAKKLRGAIQRNSIDLLRASSEIHPLNAAAVQQLTGEGQGSFDEANKVLASIQSNPPLDPKVKAALEGLAGEKSDDEVIELVRATDETQLAKALADAKERARAFDVSLGAATSKLDETEKKLASDKAMARDFLVARIEFNARRYEAEARLNQAVASLYELQVRKANISAERHQKRSKKFFSGMLAAQAAVIIATFALAARKRSLLWSVAAAAGIAAVIFAIYVYLYV